MKTLKTFSVKADGQKSLSESFKTYEFACKDGSDKILVDLELVRVLQLIRNHFGRPVSLNSAYRTESHNRAVGGVKNSFHVQGLAADFRVADRTVESVFAAIDGGKVRGIDPSKIGLGMYAAARHRFVHIDVRGKRGRGFGSAK